MKNFATISRSYLFFFIIALFCANSLNGQKQTYNSSGFFRNATIQMDKFGLAPSYIKFKEGYQPTALTFLTEYKKSFQNFSNSDNELRLVQTFEDNLGEKHYRYDQYYKGIKVEGAQIILHEKNGFVRAANGQLIHGIKLEVNPSLSENNALNNAIRNVNAQKYMWENKTNEDFLKREQKSSEATFYPKGQLILTSGKEEMLKENFKLAYRFDIYAQEPLERYFVDIDAQNGNVVNKLDRIHNTDIAGSGASLYNGNVSLTVDEVTPGSLYRLQEHTTRNAVIETYNMQNGTDYNLAVDFTAASENGIWDQTGVNVHWGSEATLDYYYNEHGRNSFNNAGGTIFSYAHAAVNYNNAFWDGTRMTYGDGDGTSFTPLVCLDVVGHEITHGVTQHSANLIYWGESGALNESFSDIFGNLVEFTKEGFPGVGTGNWRCGEDMTPSGLGIRNMQNPNEFNDPDTYFGTYWASGSFDRGGVHINSGVQNFWFYLLCEGGSGTNDNGHSYNVSATGFTKAAAIAYRNLTVYLTSSSSYYAARVASINSATDLYGAGSSEVQSVIDAWDAVGVYEPVAPSGILVWEGVLSGTDYSGAFINTFLTDAGFTTRYTNVFPPSLIGFDAVFLSYGSMSNQHTVFEDWMAAAVKNYLEAGGKLYLESADALGYEQVGNTTLLNLFGLSSASDGTTNIIDGLTGQSGAITNGMLFSSSNQVSNTWIDLFSPNTGTVAFIESGYGNVAVQNTGSYGQKTFCISYALSQLVDGASPSTKNELLAQIANFLSTPVPSFVTLSSPNGNGIWKVGTQHKIKWSKYLVDNVKLEYSTDNGTSWIDIIASTPAGTGEYEWTIPNTPSTHCKVKVSDVLNLSTSDESNNIFAIVSQYFSHTIETFDNAVGNFFPDPPIPSQNFWTNGPTAYLNLINDLEHIEGIGSTELDYRVEAYDDWGGYVVRTTYNLSNAMSLPDIDLSVGDNLKLQYKILSPAILSQTGNVYFEFKLAEYNVLGQRDLWLHRTALNLSDISGSWLEITMPLIQNNDPNFGFAPQFIEGDGILQLDKLKGFEITIYYSIAGGPINPPTAIGTLLIDNLQLAYSGILSLNSPNGGEIWKVGSSYNIKWNTSGVDNVDLSYTTDNGSSWNPIATNQPASSEKYTWTVPNTVSTQCKVKITKTGNGVSDECNGVFEIKATGVTAEVEPNNTANEAMNVGIIDEIEGTIDPENDVDYFKFTAMAGDLIQIYGEERNSSGLYGLIRLFDQNGNYLSENSGFNNTPTKQRIVYELPSNGIYYVRYSNDNNWGSYPNLAVKGKEKDNEVESMLKPNQATQKANAPLALSGEYRLMLGYFAPSAPIVMYAYYESLMYNSVKFYGAIYPNGLPTTVTFEYGLTTSYGTTIQPNPAVYEGLNAVGTNSVKVSGLQPNTPYHFRMKVENSAGINYGEDVTFITPAEPEGWVFQESGLSEYYLNFRGVHFIDENTGYVVGSSTILKTTDGGKDWTNQTITNSYGFQDIDFANSSIGVTVGGNGTIAQTTDGGTTWISQQGIVTNYYLFGISFGDANTGFAVGENGTILKTIDGGANWTLLNNNPTTVTLREVQFIDANHGTVVGYNGVIITTTDGGTNWSLHTLPSGRNLYGLHYSDASNGWAVGDGNEAYHTTNGGTTWNIQSLGNWYWLNALFFTDINNGIAVGDNGIILRTVNGGVNWSQENSGTTSSLRDVSYNIKGTIVGDNTTILRSIDYLTLNSPNGGEIWKVGSSYDIKWNTSGVDNIDLAYSTDNGSSWNPIATNQPTSSGKYTWTVPNTVSTQCKVKITKTGNGVGDESNAVFEIKAAGVTAEVEPNNTANEAMNVGIIDEIEGTIDPENDIDYFKFTGSAGDLIQIYGEERNSSGLYGLIMLFDQNGNQLQFSNYFNNTPTKQRIVYELPSNGIYYVRYSNDNNWGSYPNLAVKGKEKDNEVEIMLKPNQATQKANAPLALSGEYRLTIGYFTPSAPLLGYTYSTDLNYNSARIRGQIYPNGSATTITINWGLTTSYDHNLVVTTDANGFDQYYFTSDRLSGLNPSTQYHYQVVLQNSVGTTTGDDQTFETPSAPINWVFQNSGITDQISAVDFADINNGFAVSSGQNIILKTTDGGITWNNVCPTNLNPFFAGYGLDVINVNKIIAVGSFGFILRSEDGGNNWSSQQIGNYWHRAVSFYDANNGIVVNENGEIHKTTDGGVSWTLLTDPISTSLLTVFMLDANTVFAISSDYQVIKTSDGGLNWSSQQFIGNNWWWGCGISFSDANNGFIAIGDIYKTTDGGTTWFQINTGYSRNISVVDVNNVLASGLFGQVKRTQDGGSTWVQENTGTNNHLIGIKALSYGEAWAVGEWGTILHSEICEPGWSPVQNQQYNMNIIAELYFENQLSLDEQDIVGAFVGNECRGIASPNASLNGKIFLTVTSNVQSGEDITFKAWKSDNCEESLILETMAFQSQGEVGTISNPFVFHAGAVEVSYNFGTGYTWFSVNANPGDWNVNTVFNGLNPADNDRIIGQTNFAVYYAAGNQWVGSLTTVDPKKMYIMKLTNGQTFNLQGMPVDPLTNPISLGAGYSWLGYLPGATQPINTALQNMSPGPSDNDRLIGQTSFAVYYATGSQWIGSLANMEATKGYKIKVANSNTLTYPSNPSGSPYQIERLAKTQSPPVWTPVQGQQYNMQIIGEIVWNGQVSTNSNDIIGAFVGTECRGVANPFGSAPFPNLFFLTVSSNQSSGEQITLKVYHAGLDQIDENPSYSAVTFVNQSELGTISNPFTITSPLPVELTSFSANVNNNKVNLSWETATEVNNFGFEIEKSQTSNVKGEMWKKIGFVQGNGNSNSPKSYSFTDNNLVGGSKFQYRLKQIDADGKYTYSDVVEVEVVPTEYALHQNYPNPFNPTTTIRYSLPKASKVLLKVYDLIGNEIAALVNEEKEAGHFEVEFSGTNLTSGIYLIKLQAGDYSSVKKMMLLK